MGNGRKYFRLCHAWIHVNMNDFVTGQQKIMYFCVGMLNKDERIINNSVDVQSFRLFYLSTVFSSMNLILFVFFLLLLLLHRIKAHFHIFLRFHRRSHNGFNVLCRFSHGCTAHSDMQSFLILQLFI